MNHRPSGFSRHRLGFTLSEMMVVVGIFLVLFLVVMQMIRAQNVTGKWTDDRLGGAAGSVQAMDNLRFDAERSVCHKTAEDVVSFQDGTLRFKIANEKNPIADETVKYNLDPKNQNFLNKNDRVVAPTRFNSLVAKPALPGAKVTSFSTPNNGVVNVYVDVGAELSATTPGIKSRTTTMGMVLLFREENLRPRFSMWNDNTTLVVR
jgi:prepilin-type N-terminal cleavage/methylation domain-containing protein